MVAVNKKNLIWARHAAGLEVEDVAHKIFGTTKKHSAIDMLRLVEKGAEQPSRAQLEKMSKVYHQPLLAFYLNEPPRIGERGQDFRTVPERNIDQKANGLLNSLRRNIVVSQSLVREILEEEEYEPLPFVGSATTSMSIDSVANNIIKTLNFDLSKYRKSRQDDQAFKYLRTRIENNRIFLLLLSDLGHSTTTIPVTVFRGFVIADDIAPYIVINRKDDKRAQSFTALHEVAHLWLGSSGLSGTLGESDSFVETFCSRVAGHILLPPSELSELSLRQSTPIDQTLASIREFALQRHITSSMVSYNLRLHGRIDDLTWKGLRDKLQSAPSRDLSIDPDEQAEDSGQPTYYNVKKNHLGTALLQLTKRALDSETLSLTEASKILGVNPRVIYPLVNA